MKLSTSSLLYYCSFYPLIQFGSEIWSVVFNICPGVLFLKAEDTFATFHPSCSAVNLNDTFHATFSFLLIYCLRSFRTLDWVSSFLGAFLLFILLICSKMSSAETSFRDSSSYSTASPLMYPFPTFFYNLFPIITVSYPSAKFLRHLVRQ